MPTPCYSVSLGSKGMKRDRVKQQRGLILGLKTPSGNKAKDVDA